MILRMTLYREKSFGGKGLGAFTEDNSKTHIAGEL